MNKACLGVLRYVPWADWALGKYVLGFRVWYRVVTYRLEWYGVGRETLIQRSDLETREMIYRNIERDSANNR